MANLLSTSVYGFLCSAKEESGRRVISFKSGESGWRIKNDGDSEFNRVYARIELATKSLVFGEYDNEINARDHGDLYLGFRNTNQVYIGKDCNVGIGMSPQYKLDVNGDVRSSVFFQAGNYASGWTGNGCRMEAGGKMECTSLWVRGTMNVYELIINQVGATNGSLAVSDSGKVDVVSGFTLRLTGDNNNFNTFRPADYLLCQKFTGRTVKRYIIHVYSISGLLVSFGYAEGGIGINVVEKDDILVRWDSEDATRKGLLYLTSSDSGAPYMDVMHARKTYLRVGNLSGIGRLSGYGIVGRDADLNNVFYISSDSKANIAGWKFDKDALWVGDKQTLSAFTNSGITLSSGGAIRSMSFRSEPNGYTVLGKGNQSIAYNAANGKIEFGSDVSLNWKAPIDNLGDKVSNQGTAINDIGGSLNSLSSVVGTKTTYIDANGIYTGTLTADQVNAINVNGESLSFVKGTIAGLRFSNNALWAGNDEINDTFTGIVLGKDVSLNGVEKTGLFGVKKGITTFSFDADTGDFDFSGDLLAKVIKAHGLNIDNKFVVSTVNGITKVEIEGILRVPYTRLRWDGDEFADGASSNRATIDKYNLSMVRLYELRLKNRSVTRFDITSFQTTSYPVGAIMLPAETDSQFIGTEYEFTYHPIRTRTPIAPFFIGIQGYGSFVTSYVSNHIVPDRYNAILLDNAIDAYISLSISIKGIPNELGNGVRWLINNKSEINNERINLLASVIYTPIEL